ncbi:hypothetical protein DPMN_083769 [Dreissena polymorpha]|uniref:Uncharacterized protein n=1 Tax=Dreissena polymorpha TaxID=45954 RepID=A0A9D3YDJ8_DREPO|nr:hypothetical protein DPMN_083769 [Dreissena polymorpha]
MVETKGKGSIKLFKWPTKPDVIWVDLEQFICVIEEPVACGKTKRQFNLQDKDYSYFDID